MSKSAVVAAVGVAALAGALAVWWAGARKPAPPRDETLAAYRRDVDYGGLTIHYPPDGAVFPPEIAGPTFRWSDTRRDSNTWLVAIEFRDGGEPLTSRSSTERWTPSDEQWRTIKRRSLENDARVTVLGVNGAAPRAVLSAGRAAIRTSADPVGAPIFYREVIPPFKDAVMDPSGIVWRFGDISAGQRPPIVLQKLPVCANCHSFSNDGKVLGMDVDYGNDKGSYVIAPVTEEIVLDKRKIISWSDYRREDGVKTFGLLSAVSPDGRYVVSTVKDRSVSAPKGDPTFSLEFFPIKGILAVYSRRTRTFAALPGADDRRFVQSNPAWSPDGKTLVFARSKVHRLAGAAEGSDLVLTTEQARKYLLGEKPFQYDLYHVPFNDGRGGRAEPLEGASNNGMSNYFPKYSPDGKWIVFCRARRFMLLQPDSELYIIPAAGGEARRLRCNTPRMNSWHSWSPNSRWLVFSSKANSAYTQLFLAHVDEAGRSSPAVLLERFTSPDRAANIPEFVNVKCGAIKRIREEFVYDLNEPGYEDDFLESLNGAEPGDKGPFPE